MKDVPLNRDRILDRLHRTVTNSPGAANVLLAGPWGSGKTTLLEGLRDKLEPEADKYLLLEFSPWEQVGDGDPRTGFLQYLSFIVLDYDKRHKGEVEKLVGPARWVWDGFSSFAKTAWPTLLVSAVPVAIPELAPVAPFASLCVQLTQALLNARKERREPDDKAGSVAVAPMTALRDDVGVLLKQLASFARAKRIVLLVDDLDRTRPEYAIAVLDSLYHMFMPRRGEDEWPLSSVWAVNIAMLEEFLYAHYRHQPSFDPTAYLEKMFDCRVNVPPLFQGARESRDGAIQPTDDISKLWAGSLERFLECNRKGLDRLDDPSLINYLGEEAPRELAAGLNYAVLGNLRLYQGVRDRCTDYWEHLLSRESAFHRARLVRDAQLVTLIHAYPGFREDIALYSGMWPHFLNRLNDRLRSTSYEAPYSPTYRHVDDPSLITLLTDLELLRFDRHAQRFVLIDNSEIRLAEELGSMLQAGY